MYGNPDFAMGYGSGVFAQEGYSTEDKPMIDLVLGLKSTANFHTQNLNNNSEDYSLLTKIFGPKLADYLQKMGVGIYYNPYVDFEGQSIKYGVISLEDLKKDLLEWTHLYVAGRLQKPVEILQTTPEIKKAIEINLQQALTTSLLLLPENFTEKELFMTIAGLSYQGDSRMKYGENKQKVRNIIEKNEKGFHDLYTPAIENSTAHVTRLNDGCLQQDQSPQKSIELFQQLPSNLKSEIGDITHINQLAEKIKQAIATIVHASSIEQTVKGVLTAGGINSIKYATEKIKKAQRK